jgi:hypothetical protein
MRSVRLAAAMVVVAAFSIGLAGQVAPPATAAVSALTPRTPWGDPDLQGVWNVASGTPLERPATYAGREFLTDEELLQAEKEANERTNADRRLGAGTLADLRREHNEFWFDKRTTILTNRTSLITDPPDGKLPPLTPEAAKKTVPPAAVSGADVKKSRRHISHGGRDLACPVAHSLKWH